jgi:hypothetical protein
MKDWIRQALTKTVQNKTTRITEQTLETAPDERLVLGVKFAVAMTLCLSALETAHIAFLGTWNSEIFSAITGLTGTITGIFITQKA